MSETDTPEVASPCNNICTLNRADICIGCGRSLAEVGTWSQATRDERLRIVAAAQRRLAAIIGASAGGRA